jgi:hypothetical protein
VRYELLLQPRIAGTRLDLDAVERAFVGLAMKPVGANRVWSLPEGDVDVSLVREGASTVAVALAVPLSDRSALVLACLREALKVTAVADVSVVDPQVGSTVNAASEGSVEAEFLRAARYAGEFAGVSDALGASFRPNDDGMPFSTRLLIAFVVFLVMAMLAYRVAS